MEEEEGEEEIPFKVWPNKEYAQATYEYYLNKEGYPKMLFDPVSCTYTILYVNGYAKVDLNGTLIEVVKDEETDGDDNV